MPDNLLPVLGLTLGDAAGVGPEVVARALADPEVYDCCRPMVLGDLNALLQARGRLGLDLDIRALTPGSLPAGRPGTAEVLPLGELSSDCLVPGRPTPEGGLAAARFIETGARLALDGLIQGLVTAPISKESLNKAGYHFPGHTEMLAHLAGGARVVMMLAGPRLRVVPVTIHEAIQDVPRLLTVDRILETSLTTYKSLQRYFGLTRPRLAVAALNPHAGEAGLFGNEESTIIVPAMEKARAMGAADISGPYPPDTVFHRAAQGEFDAVVCMYHDQGLIPLKLLHFKDAVNVTLGLPFIRTSVDHGTAYDIAGKGLADPSSMLAAIRLAADMAGRSA